MSKLTTLMVFLILLVVPFVSGFDTSTGSYSVDSYHTGVSGSEPNTTSYSSRSTTTYQQGGNSNGTTTSYSFSSGLFEDVSVSEDGVVSSTLGSGGGGGGGAAVECSINSDCEENRYCFQNSCFDAECSEDSQCNTAGGEVCWSLRCVNLFDIKIIDFESPIQLGGFFEFTYFLLYRRPKCFQERYHPHSSNHYNH